jgi:actin-related protein 2
MYFGNEAMERRNQLELSNVLSEGMIRDWEGLEKLWGYCFDQIGCKTRGESILVTEAVLNPIENRDRIAEILFEKYEFERAIIEA